MLYDQRLRLYENLNQVRPNLGTIIKSLYDRPQGSTPQNFFLYNCLAHFLTTFSIIVSIFLKCSILFYFALLVYIFLLFSTLLFYCLHFSIIFYYAILLSTFFCNILFYSIIVSIFRSCSILLCSIIVFIFLSCSILFCSIIFILFQPFQFQSFSNPSIPTSFFLFSISLDVTSSRVKSGTDKCQHLSSAELKRERKRKLIFKSQFKRNVRR